MFAIALIGDWFIFYLLLGDASFLGKVILGNVCSDKIRSAIKPFSQASGLVCNMDL